jgi:membrane-associated phospholipid phosphatase
MKLFFRRKRPPTLYAAAMKVKSYSFPSSHAYSAALAGGYLGAEAFAAGVVVVGISLWLFAIVIGISRVYVGAHYPSDVLAGWVLGGGIAWFIATLF